MRYRVYFIVILILLAGFTLYAGGPGMSVLRVLVLALLWAGLFAAYLILAETRIRRGFRTFLEVAGRFVAGDPTARSDIRSGPPELQHVSRRFDVILDRLAERESSLTELQHELRESERRYRRLFENSPAAIWLLDYSPIRAAVDAGLAPRGTTLRGHLAEHPEIARDVLLRAKIVTVNRATLRMLHAESTDHVRIEFDRYLGETSTQSCTDTVLAVAERKVAWETTSTRHTFDGRPIQVLARSLVVPGHEASYDQVIVAALDVTAQAEADEASRRQEAELARAARLASLGTLVAGVAHEINNPVGFIRLQGENLLDLHALLSEALVERHAHLAELEVKGIPLMQAWQSVLDAVNSVLDGSARIERLVTELREFSRDTAVDDRSEVDVNAAIDASLRILAPLIRRSTDHLVFHGDPGSPRVVGSTQKLEQVIINVVSNACQALSSRDRSIVIRTEQGSRDNEVRITVEDEGNGIAESDLPHLFEPFFTTRRGKGGTGLGLAISRRIVVAHGGSITVDSVPSGGVRVTIRLPLPSNHQDGKLD